MNFIVLFITWFKVRLRTYLKSPRRSVRKKLVAEKKVKKLIKNKIFQNKRSS